MSDDTHESLLRFKMDRMEERMKSDLTATLYGGGKPRELTEAQKARAPGFYWVRDRSLGGSWADWRVDEWGHNCWTTTGSEEDYRDDPDEVGPRVEPPAA